MALGKDWVPVAGPGLLDPGGLCAAAGSGLCRSRGGAGRAWLFTIPPLWLDLIIFEPKGMRFLQGRLGFV